MVTSIITAVALLVPSSVRSARDAKAEQDKLQGTWVAAEIVIRGKPVGKEVRLWRLVVKGNDHAQSWLDGGHKMRVHSIDLRKDLKRIEFRDHPDELSKGLGRVTGRYKSVYEIDGDTLKQCIQCDPMGGYPEKIEKDNPDYLYLEWKRAKAK